MGYHLGVDLGTTFTAAAVSNGQPPTMLGLGNRAMQVPSVLFLQADGGFLVGEAAERRGAIDPDRVAREFKRRIGDPVPIFVAGTPHSAQSLTAHLLRWVVGVAAERMGEPATRITVTFPANWGEYRQELLRQILSLADLPEAMTCPEPTAAAIQYAAQARVPAGARIAVYDLGGGTFDVCIVEKGTDGFSILGAPEGIDQLGGIDFDEALFRNVLLDLQGSMTIDIDDPTMLTGLARLRRACVEAKESLSGDVDTVVPVSLPGVETQVRVTRSQLEDLIRPSISTTIEAMERAMRSANLAAGDLQAIVLIGGSSRIPLITEMLFSAFGTPTALDTHPKHDIALGAVRNLSPAPTVARDHRPEAVATAPARTTTPSAPAVPTLPTVAPTSSPPSDRSPTGARSRPPLPIVVLSIALVAAIIVGAVWIVQRHGSPAKPANAAKAVTLAWTRLPNLPQPVDGAGVAAYKGKIWLIGGLSADAARQQIDKVSIYDPKTKIWSAGPRLPRPISHVAVVVAGPDLVLLGGYVASGGSRDVLRLSKDGRTWQRMRSLPESRVAGAAAWDGRRIIFAGGTEQDQTASRDIWGYESGRWTELGQLQHGRAKLAAFTNGQGEVWFAGGYDKNTNTRYGDLDEVLEGQVQKRSTYALGTPTDSAAALTIPGGGKCLLGGQTPAGYNGWWCDNAKFAASLPALNPPRAGLGAAVLDGTIYEAGGYNDSLSTGTDLFEALTPPDPTAAVVAGSQTFPVTSTLHWMPTSVVVRAGEILNLSATGEIRDDLTRPNQTFPPDGATRLTPDVHDKDPYLQFHHAALLGRFGAKGVPFFVGKALQVDTVAQPGQIGQLYLGIDDSAVTDNTGDFTVTAKITPAG